jgi:hypothetical protein
MGAGIGAIFAQVHDPVAPGGGLHPTGTTVSAVSRRARGMTPWSGAGTPAQQGQAEPPRSRMSQTPGGRIAVIRSSHRVSVAWESCCRQRWTGQVVIRSSPAVRGPPTGGGDGHEPG